MAEGDDHATHRRHVNPVEAEAIISDASQRYGVKADEYIGFRNDAAGRDMAARLCRRYTRATLRELPERFGLSHPDSASDLIRRGAKRVEQSREAVRQQRAIEKKLELNSASRFLPEWYTPAKDLPSIREPVSLLMQIPQMVGVS